MVTITTTDEYFSVDSAALHARSPASSKGAMNSINENSSAVSKNQNQTANDVSTKVPTIPEGGNKEEEVKPNPREFWMKNFWMKKCRRRSQSTIQSMQLSSSRKPARRASVGSSLLYEFPRRDPRELPNQAVDLFMETRPPLHMERRKSHKKHFKRKHCDIFLAPLPKPTPVDRKSFRVLNLA